MSKAGRDKARRTYSPAVEALEALRLLDHATASLLTPSPADVDPRSFSTPIPIEPSDPGHDAWDAALGATEVDDLLAPAAAVAPTINAAPADPAAMRAGFDQLDRYLARAWYRAGIPADKFDDCTQAVYVTLLQTLGRGRFDALVSEVGSQGIREVLSRETAEGPDFFRAIDMVKKRTLREKQFQALDSADVPGSDGATATEWRSVLDDAIARSLNRREADLMRATLQGKTPAEIATEWGIAPKTVSNEKTRAFQKLREALVADLVD